MDLNGFVYYEQKNAKKGKPTVTIYSKGGVIFNSDAARALNNPSYVTLQYHRAKKIIFIKKSDENNSSAIKVSEHRHDICLLRKDITNIIFDEITNWSRLNYGYKCYGKYDPMLDGVIFDLNISELIDRRNRKTK